MEFQDVIEQRYSARAFTDEPVSEADINAVLEAFRLAPSARNCQPTRVYVVTKSDDLEAIGEYSPCRFNAPVVFILGYSASEAASHKDDGRGAWTYGEVDLALALSQMTCKATDLGLGSCIVGLFNEAQIRDHFGIDDDVVIMSLLPVGHPAPTCKPSPMHETRLPLSKTVTWL